MWFYNVPLIQLWDMPCTPGIMLLASFCKYCKYLEFTIFDYVKFLNKTTYFCCIRVLYMYVYIIYCATKYTSIGRQKVCIISNKVIAQSQKNQRSIRIYLFIQDSCFLFRLLHSFVYFLKVFFLFFFIFETYNFCITFKGNRNNVKLF